MSRPLADVPQLNEKSGNWTVVSEVFKKEDGRSNISVQCVCGNIRDMRPAEFRNNLPEKCVLCSVDKNRKVTLEERYNNFVVVAEDKDAKGRLVWVCLCDCGNIENVKGTDLISGRKKFCFECYEAGRCEVDTLSFYLRRVKDKAAIRGIHFALTEVYVRQLIENQQYLCALSGVPIWFAATTPEHTHGGTTASLDRIDSDGGYTEGNVQFIHKDLNTMKMDLSQEQFIQMCNNVAAFNPLPEDVRIGYGFECRRPNHSEGSAQQPVQSAPLQPTQAPVTAA